jgi:3-deoxy-manno-octulosonate cytidylyltransferase (CMP-KDO synthetase)
MDGQGYEVRNSLERWLVVIPARLHSTRLPRKALADIGGLPMIVRVAQNMRPLAEVGATIVVATDHKEIANVCRQHGIYFEMTSAEHQSGTDRCYEVAKRHQHPFVLNIQGDEPYLAPKEVENLIAAFSEREEADIGTLAFKCFEPTEFVKDSTVKAVRSTEGFSLYFSRSPIPASSDETILKEGFLLHQGIYCFRRAALERFCSLSVSSLERRERLEQLRALEAGLKIYVHLSSHRSIGIDTPEDLEAARAYFR